MTGQAPRDRRFGPGPRCPAMPDRDGPGGRRRRPGPARSTGDATGSARSADCQRAGRPAGLRASGFGPLVCLFRANETDVGDGRYRPEFLGGLTRIGRLGYGARAPCGVWARAHPPVVATEARVHPGRVESGAVRCCFVCSGTGVLLFDALEGRHACWRLRVIKGGEGSRPARCCEVSKRAVFRLGAVLMLTGRHKSTRSTQILKIVALNQAASPSLVRTNRLGAVARWLYTARIRISFPSRPV